MVFVWRFYKKKQFKIPNHKFKKWSVHNFQNIWHGPRPLQTLLNIAFIDLKDCCPPIVFGTVDGNNLATFLFMITNYTLAAKDLKQRLMQSMYCNQCSAIYVLQSMYCNLCTQAGRLQSRRLQSWRLQFGRLLCRQAGGLQSARLQSGRLLCKQAFWLNVFWNETSSCEGATRLAVSVAAVAISVAGGRRFGRRRSPRHGQDRNSTPLRKTLISTKVTTLGKLTMKIVVGIVHPPVSRPYPATTFLLKK